MKGRGRCPTQINKVVRLLQDMFYVCGVLLFTIRDDGRGVIQGKVVHTSKDLLKFISIHFYLHDATLLLASYL